MVDHKFKEVANQVNNDINKVIWRWKWIKIAAATITLGLGLFEYVLNRRRKLKETFDFKLVVGEEMVWLDVIEQHSVEEWWTYVCKGVRMGGEKSPKRQKAELDLALMDTFRFSLRRTWMDKDQEWGHQRNDPR